MKIIQSKLLKNFSSISHCFTAKKNGNLAFHVGDIEKNVKDNHKILADIMRYNLNSVVHMKQIHSDVVHIVSENDNFENPPTCDALITNKKNIPLMVMVADCSPVILYDSEKSVIAVAHVGRAGAFQNILKNVIDTFVNYYNSNPADINVSVGASIGSCCYEVGEEIYDEAKTLHLEYAVDKKENSFYLNISKIIQSQLFECGISEENIEISQECTCCLKEDYYSYRAEKITGRFAGVVFLT